MDIFLAGGGWRWVFQDTLWLVVGGIGWWRTYFVWWWVVVGGGRSSIVCEVNRTVFFFINIISV